MKQHLNLELREKRKHVPAEWASGQTDTPVRDRLNWDKQVSFCSTLLHLQEGRFLSLRGHTVNYNTDAKKEDTLGTAFH